MRKHSMYIANYTLNNWKLEVGSWREGGRGGGIKKGEKEGQ